MLRQLGTNTSAVTAAIDGGSVERFYTAKRPRAAGLSKTIERFVAGHGYADTGTTAASVTDDTTVVGLGDRALKVVTKTDNTFADVQKTGQSIDATGKMFKVWFSLENITNLVDLYMYAGNDAMSSYYSFHIGSGGTDTAQQIAKEGELFAVTLGWADAFTVGSPTRSGITNIRFRTKGQTGQAVTLRVAGIGLCDETLQFPTGVISFAADDSYASQYTKLRPMLDAYGYGATAYTIVDKVDSGAGWLTLAQLKELEKAHGWEVGGHAFTTAMHTEIAAQTINLSNIDADTKATRTWLVQNGFRAADHYAYPGGGFSPDSTDVTRHYFATARTVINRTEETVRPADPMRLRSISVTPSYTVANVKAMIDRAVTGKGHLIITVHDLIDSGTPGSTQWMTADMQTIVDYVYASGATVLNVGDVVDRMAIPNASVAAPPDVATESLNIRNAVHSALGGDTSTVFAMRRIEAGASVTTVAGRMDIVCFTPIFDLTISKLEAMAGGTVWSGATLARLGLYTVNASNVVTLVAATASDTTMFVGANVVYQRALSTGGALPSTYALQKGQRYAIGILGVGQTAGQVRGGSVSSSLSTLNPHMGGTVGTGLTDLPTTGTLVAQSALPWAAAVA